MASETVRPGARQDCRELVGDIHRLGARIAAAHEALLNAVEGCPPELLKVTYSSLRAIRNDLEWADSRIDNTVAELERWGDRWTR